MLKLENQSTILLLPCLEDKVSRAHAPITRPSCVPACGRSQLVVLIFPGGKKKPLKQPKKQQQELDDVRGINKKESSL